MYQYSIVFLIDCNFMCFFVGILWFFLGVFGVIIYVVNVMEVDFVFLCNEIYMIDQQMLVVFVI